MNVSVRFAAAIVLIVSLVGCVTGEKMSRVQPGMTTAEVTSALGKPDGYKQMGGYEVYRYSNRLSSGWSWDRADYNVVFKNGRVVEYGAGQIRPKSNGAIVIVPVGS
jgi:SmpA / OmlA family